MALTRNGVTYRVADSHAHIYPDKIAEKATASVGTFYDKEMESLGTTRELLRCGSAAGVDRYLVSSVATKVEQVRSISAFLAGECEKHPEFLGLGAWHQDVTDAAEELSRIEALGLRGVKLHPDFQKADIDDPRLLPLYEEAQARGLAVLFHMGDYRMDFSRPKKLARITELFPRLLCIGAHLGGYTTWDTALEELPASENLFVDTSSSLWFLTPEKARRNILHFGVERTFFAVDFPMWRHGDETERFFALGFSEEENRKMLWENFAAVFGLKEEPLH